MKQLLQDKLNEKTCMNAQSFIVDGFPMGTAHFIRAKKSKSFKGEAEYGYASKCETDYGFKGYLLVDNMGNIVNFTLPEASGSEREAV